MRALITGGCGFFGHHLIEHLLKKTDWEVVVVDKLNYASMGFDRLRDIGCFDDKRITRLVHDLATPFSEGLVKEIGPIDYILHLAAETHVDNSIVNPRSFVLANVVGTLELLELARALQPKRFVYFSTDEVFGPAAFTNLNCQYSGHNLSHYFQYREWDRYNSTNPYSASKAGAEELVLAYGNTYGLPVLITHCMNLFGERQHPEKFIPLVVRKVLAGETVSIHADSFKQTSGSRTYIHARNASDAVLHVLTKLKNVTRDKFNIVGDEEVSNLELAKLIARKLRGKLIYEMVDFHSSRPGHDLRYSLDGSKLHRTGWTSPMGFEESLAKTVEWYVANPRWLT